MQHQRSSSNFISSFNHDSIVNNHGLIRQNVESLNASGQGDHSSSIGWIDQSSSIGSSHNQVTPVESNAGHGWLPSPDANIETSQRLEEMQSEPNDDKIPSTGLVILGSSTSRSVTSDAVPKKLDLNVEYEDSNGNPALEQGVDYVNQTSSLERNTEIFERNTCRRINSANEYNFPSSNMSSAVSVGTTTSQMFQSSYLDWITSPSSSSTSSISRVIPASGSDALWQEDNSRYFPGGTSMHSFIVHGTERGNPGQILTNSRPFPQNYSSQNGTMGVQVSAAPTRGSDALWLEENPQYIPRGTSVQSMLVPGSDTGNPGQTLTNSRPFPQNYSSQNGTTGVQMSAPWQNMLVSGTERGNPGHQNLINSRAVPRNYSLQNDAASAHLSPSPGFPQHNGIRGFQNGFTGGIHLSSTPPGFPPRNMVEEYEQRLSDIVNRSRMRLDGFGSGGQIGYHNPPSITSVSLRGMPESGPGNVNARQGLPRPRILMVRAGHTDVVPPILPPLQPLVAYPSRSRMVHRALEILNRIDRIGLQYEDGLIVHDPMFNESSEEDHNMHEDMRLDAEDMSYEELLALDDEIGNVNTGLSEEAILRGLRWFSYRSMRLGPPVEGELCCICQDDYVDGEEVAKLECGHNFHFNCIKQWLVQKNTCPICKTIALAI